MRRNLENFSRAFGKLSPEKRKELIGLLVQEVRYNQAEGKIKLILRPLPDLGWSVNGDEISFDESQNWLRR
ncbi:MAG: hypothetical protein PHF00_01455 [Elusimicrobia bacterium]|nr:hypothetical protein [Elusimicrobiota bacterium]